MKIKAFFKENGLIILVSTIASVIVNLLIKWGEKMFETQVFESLEINTSKKIFKINGEDFGKYCDKYNIEIYQENAQIVVIFRRHGVTKFVNKYDARTGKIKSRLREQKRLL